MVEVFCSHCGAPLSRAPSQIKQSNKNNRYFCDRVCATAYRREHAEMYSGQRAKTRQVPALRVGGVIYA